MIFDASTLPLPLRLRADLCVIGSGPGGAMAAMVAAEKGLSVVLLEAGEFLTPADMVQREEVMFPLLYWEGGGRTTKDRGIHIHQGRGVGGSSLHNLNLCKRIPSEVLARWRETRGLSTLPPATWDELYREVEALLAVSEVPRSMWNRHNLALEAGARALGWAGAGLSHNRTGCIGSGYCEVGCSYDAKNNAAKVLIPRAVKAGAEVLTRCQAIRVEHKGGRVRGVVAAALDAATRKAIGEVFIEAGRVCVAASATGTAAILIRSEIPDPSGETGNTLRIHPAVVAAGEFDEPIYAWRGIPQTFECTEHLEFDRDDGHRSWIVTAFAHPVGTSTLIPGHGASHRALMERYAHLGAFTAMLHDHTAGRVRPDGDFGVSIEYWPDEADRRELAHGLWACARLLVAGGARRIIIPSRPPRFYNANESIEDLREFSIELGALDLTAVHPMGTVPMGDDPKRSAVDSEGKHHHMEGLWVADGSLFPTSIGGPPQLSIYALGLHVGRALSR
ncbi:MAG: GMC family oxidoreductase [Polyangiaceae bacterium]|nr:GMC family oxidoreductase [Polyangiaceae bacterium]